MVFFNIDVHFDTSESDSLIHKPEISVYDTTLLGAVNQILGIVSSNAISKITHVSVWYIGKCDVEKSVILSYKDYNGENFIAMIKNTLGEELI